MIRTLYHNLTGQWPTEMRQLTAAGSPRRYWRLTGPGLTCIGAEGPNIKENQAFIYMSRHFADKGLPVPQVLAVSDDSSCYLVTDLGDTSLWDCRDDVDLLKKAIAILPLFQTVGAEGFDYSRCYQSQRFDASSVMLDLHYFKYTYLNVIGVSYDELRLEKEFQRLADMVGRLTYKEGGLMLRDFQSRNVMIVNGEPYVIDFQGARQGPLVYDVASFCFQAKARFAPGLRDELFNTYLDHLPLKVDRNAFTRHILEVALVRTLQVLGAYGLRGLVEGKPHFLTSIPMALDNLRQLMPVVRDSYLYYVLSEVVARPPYPIEPPFDGLTVRVGSFSYKKGLPLDPSGNGGGFVFDCRAMENPGRYPEYKTHTGRDPEVIEFLEAKGEIQPFLESCYSLVDNAIADYLRRGFTALSVQFGCTGGQHRSVYSADHAARHIKERFPQVRVLLNHREQHISETL